MTACVCLFCSHPVALGLSPQSPVPLACQAVCSLWPLPSCLFCHFLFMSCDVCANPGDNPPARSSRALCGIRPGHSDVGRGSFAAPHPHTALSDRARRAFFMRLLQCGASGDIVVLVWRVVWTAATVHFHELSWRCSTRPSRCCGRTRRFLFSIVATASRMNDAQQSTQGRKKLPQHSRITPKLHMLVSFSQ